MTIDKRYEYRQQKVKLLVEEFYNWINVQIDKTLPQSLLGNAIIYAQNQKNYLLEFLNDGRIEISNNRAERPINPFVIGRKN